MSNYKGKRHFQPIVRFEDDVDLVYFEDDMFHEEETCACRAVIRYEIVDEFSEAMTTDPYKVTCGNCKAWLAKRPEYRRLQAEIVGMEYEIESMRYRRRELIKQLPTEVPK